MLFCMLGTNILGGISFYLKESLLLFKFASVLNYVLGGVILLLIGFLVYLLLAKKTLFTKNDETVLKIDSYCERLLSIYEGMAYARNIDDAWSFKHLSAKSYTLTGYSMNEMLDAKFSFKEIIQPKYRSFISEKMDECILARDSYEEEYKIITKSGEEKWVRDYGKPVFDADGNVSHLEGFIADITKEKEMAFKSFFNEARYKSLIDNSEFPIMVFYNHKIIYANPASASFFKASSKKEIEGMRFDELITEDYKEFYKTRYDRIQKTRTSNMPTNYKFKRFDGEIVTAHLSTSIFFYEDELYLHITLLEIGDSEYSAQQLKRMQKRNRDLILYMHEGIGVFQKVPEKNDGKLVFANKNFSRFIMGRSENLIYKTFSEIFSGFSKEEIDEIFSTVISATYKKQIINNFNKHYYDYLFYQNKDNELIVQITDVTDKILANQKYLKERNSLNDILEATKTVTWEWDLISGNIQVDYRWKAIYDYEDEFFNSLTFNKFKRIIHPNDLVPAGKRMVSLIRNTVDDTFSIELRTRHRDGHYIWGLYRGKVFERDRNRRPTRISGTFQDISDLKAKEAEIHFLSMHDHLTGLHNRRYLEEKLMILDNADNYPLTIMLADVDALKIINDAFGHEEGDKLLMTVAKVLKKYSKQNEILARTGGDEFIMVLPKASINDAKNRTMMIKKELSKIRIKGIQISISIGYASKTSKSQNIENIKNIAETKMYDSKINNASSRQEVLEMIRDNLFSIYSFEKRVAELTHDLSMKMAKILKLETIQTKVVDLASQYYNIGVIAINKKVLDKDLNIDEDAKEEYRKHVEIGFRILSSIFKFENVASTVLYHHEKYNGKGYPSGLKKDEIPIASRIIAICGAYSRHLLSKSNIKKASVIKFIESERGVSFDPKLVDILIEKII